MKNNNKLIKRTISCFVVFVILLFTVSLTIAEGTPHIIHGKLFNSIGTSPQNSNLQIYAYNPERPDEILSKTIVGCGYELYSDGWYWFEAGNYITPWETGNNIRIIAVDNLASETGVIDFVLDDAGNQLLTDYYLVSGDNAGPIASNTLADGNSLLSIPEGTASVILTATVDDLISGNMNIQSAEYYINTDPGTGLGISMQPDDSVFDSPQEDVNASVDTSLWMGGEYSVYVRGIDSAGNWGLSHNVEISVCPNPPSWIDGTSQYYSNLQNSYNDAIEEDIIKSQSATFTGDLNMNQNKSVTLDGGYDCSYTTNTGMTTTIIGNLTISNGTVTIGNFVLE